jgi:hypothetical protein
VTTAYATTTQYEQSGWYYGSTPANIDRLLLLASQRVDEATVAAIYDTDDTGQPTDPNISAAFTEAVCAQVAAWQAAGIADPSAGALMQPGAVRSSKSLDGASIGYDNSLVTGATATAERQRLARELCDEAAAILRQAGLTPGTVWVYG